MGRRLRRFGRRPACRGGLQRRPGRLVSRGRAGLSVLRVSLRACRTRRRPPTRGVSPGRMGCPVTRCSQVSSMCQVSPVGMDSRALSGRRVLRGSTVRVDRLGRRDSSVRTDRLSRRRRTDRLGSRGLTGVVFSRADRRHPVGRLGPMGRRVGRRHLADTRYLVGSRCLVGRLGASGRMAGSRRPVAVGRLRLWVLGRSRRSAVRRWVWVGQQWAVLLWVRVCQGRAVLRRVVLGRAVLG
ncbi:MAG: hypothetical protein QOH03_1947 [Kribbellaceae bacterium]|nr:hypothetical protein [Kribbellaceae bacterium]